MSIWHVSTHVRKVACIVLFNAEHHTLVCVASRHVWR